MATRAKKISIYLRFDIGNSIGLGHASRCIELAKNLKKNFNVNLCTNLEAKKILKNKEFKFFIKKKNEKEENYILRIAKNKKEKILFIDNLYNYKSGIIKKVSQKFIKVFFYQNFSKGIQKSNIIIDPTPNLNSSRNIKKKYKDTKIFSSEKYLIVPKSYSYKKKNYLGISFGGSDPKLISFKILKYLNKMKWKHDTYLFLGPMFKFKNQLKEKIAMSNIKICNFDKRKFLRSSLAICSPGLTAFELLNNKIFSLYISHSKKHHNLGKFIVKKFNYSKNLKIYNELNFDNFKKIINYYWNCKKNPNSLKQKKLNMMYNSCKKILRLILNETKQK